MSDFPSKQYHVFLSHNSSDKAHVERIAVRLEDEAGLKPFLDKWHLVPGEPWQETLEEALDNSETCAVFLGTIGIGPWENEEMRSALDGRVRDKSLRVIPVLLPGANPKDNKTLPRFLRRLTWVDFRKGIDEEEAFNLLIAGICGVAPGRQPSTLRQVIPDAHQSAVPIHSRLWKRFASIFGNQKEGKGELKKVAVAAILALLLSTPFISASIPRYKLQIKSPAFRKDGVYETPVGTVIIKWAITKDQWFQESDINDGKANLIIRKISDEKEETFQNLPGEFKKKMEPGKYEVRIDAIEYGRIEIIALQISGPINDSLPEIQPDEASNNGVIVNSKETKTHNTHTRHRSVPAGTIVTTVEQNTVTKITDRFIPKTDVSDNTVNHTTGNPSSYRRGGRNLVGEAQSERSVLRGVLVDQGGHEVRGAKVSIDNLPIVKTVETSIKGVFSFNAIPRKYGDVITLRILIEGNQYTEDVKLGENPPKITIRRER